MNNVDRIYNIIREASNAGDTYRYHVEALTDSVAVSTADLDEYVAEFIGLDSADLEYKSSDMNNNSIAKSLLGWIRTDMKKAGLIVNPKMGTWCLANSDISVELAKEAGKKESARKAANKRNVKDLRDDIVKVFRSFDSTTKDLLRASNIDKDAIENIVTAHNCTVDEAYHMFLNNV